MLRNFTRTDRLTARSGAGTLKQRMAVLRIIYAALILGQVAYLLVVLFGLMPREGQQRGMMVVYGWIDWAMLASTVPITYAIRAVIFGACRNPSSIPMDKFIIGDLIFWAGCEAVLFISLTFAYLTAATMPEMLIAGLCFVLQFATFPRRGSVAD